MADCAQSPLAVPELPIISVQVAEEEIAAIEVQESPLGSPVAPLEDSCDGTDAGTAAASSTTTMTENDSSTNTTAAAAAAATTAIAEKGAADGAGAKASAQQGDGNGDGDAAGEEAFVFEGPEKCLEVDFCVGSGPIDGLRAIPRPLWDELLASCGCEIISVKSNEEIDSYVLSESSLFVYRWKMVLKTCGKTTPLRAIPHLQKLCTTYEMEMEWMGFSRKNYNFPVLQVHPHTNFSDEVRYIQDTLQRGEGHILGPLTGDHWYLYVAELSNNYTHPQTDFKMDIMMYGLDKQAADVFFQKEGSGRTAEQVRKAIEFEKYFVGAKVHDVLFEPCGYSLNALRGDTYYTMHVTPEEEFSYASFETNLDAKSYEALVQYILGIFNPRRFTITVFYDVEEDTARDGMMRVYPRERQNPLDQTIYTSLSSKYKYRRCLKTESQFLGEFVGGIGNWKRVDDVSKRTPKTRAASRYHATVSAPAF